VLNDKQKKNLWLGIIAMVAMGIYPPWKEFGTVERPSVFAPINQPPAIVEGISRVDIDFSRLGIELFLATVVTGALVATAAGRPDPPSFIPAGNKTPSAAGSDSEIGRGAAALNQNNGGAKAVKTTRVELPQNYYLGEIFVESDDDAEYWDDYCPAKGSIDLPKGKKIQLELAKDIKVDLSFLSAFPSDALYSVDASDAQVSDEDLSKLGALTSIKELDLSGTNIGSTGVTYLKSLARLEKLWLDRTAIDDQCVPALISLNKLKKLSISQTKLNELALENLKKDLPNCEVITA